MDKVLLTLKPNIVAQNKEALSKLESIKRQQNNKVSMELKFSRQMDFNVVILV